MRVDVQLNRCLCIHSMSQVVDTILQVLLYQRGVIPEPVQQLLHNGERNDQKTEKFELAYNDVKRVIRHSFRKRTNSYLKEFVILIGSSPHLPKEIYRIPIITCAHSHTPTATSVPCNISFESDDEIDEITSASAYNVSNATPTIDCGANCSALTKREKRYIFSSLTLDKDVQSLLENCTLSNNDKVFLFVGSTSKANQSVFNVEGLEEDEDFELPDINLRKRRKIRCFVVRILCPKHESEERTPLSSRKRHAQCENGSDKISSKIPNVGCIDGSGDTGGNVYSDDNDEEEDFQNDAQDNSSWFRVLQFFKRVQ